MGVLHPVGPFAAGYVELNGFSLRNPISRSNWHRCLLRLWDYGIALLSCNPLIVKYLPVLLGIKQF